MASTVTFSSPLFFSCCRRSNPLTFYQYHPHPSLRFLIPPLRYRLRASGRFSNYSQEGGNMVSDLRHWGASAVVANYYVDDNSEDDDDDDDEDRSLDLLVRFIHNMFRKISRRARKAVRSVIPISISTKLVGFSVNGVIILAFLWILKAFLEVVCTIGSLVFLSILLIRGVWSGVSYLQENRNYNSSNTDDQSHRWTGAQPVT
ncbi:protein SHORT HYPOCOTYL IN WHITE LIGHT 1-like [Macadamia integrifolia]|uniref:protein SHORT HYPOCOTYL IN WHITE LIGHT 1-like n=1 Tax=Macadamia integrifolia TaxID=60698 RepID=UPI001C4F0718|nr:protein SHORT HYPOCOTYL IN WHITE LIGHT 1-like [Macadamia integrifolia]